MLVMMAAGHESNFDFPLTVLTGGALLRGRIAPPEKTATVLDDAVIDVAKTATITPHDPKDPSADPDAFRVALVRAYEERFFSKLVANDRERHRALLDKFNTEDALPALEDLSDDDATAFITDTNPTVMLDLSNAELRIGSHWEWIGLARVRLDAIDAWWPSQQ